jgi:hypothetical protein
VSQHNNKQKHNEEMQVPIESNYLDVEPELFLKLDWEDPELLYFIEEAPQQQQVYQFNDFFQPHYTYTATQKVEDLWMFEAQATTQCLTFQHQPVIQQTTQVKQEPRTPTKRTVKQAKNPSVSKTTTSSSTCSWEFIEYNKPAKSKLVPVKNVYKKATTAYDGMVTKMTYL